MDSLIESALNAAALRPNCRKHPERPATSTLYGIPKCRECVAESIAFHATQRAFGTGCGPEAHAEAQESGRYQDEERAARREYVVTLGGKPK